MLKDYQRAGADQLTNATNVIEAPSNQYWQSYVADYAVNLANYEYLYIIQSMEAWYDGYNMSEFRIVTDDNASSLCIETGVLTNFTPQYLGVRMKKRPIDIDQNAGPEEVLINFGLTQRYAMKIRMPKEKYTANDIEFLGMFDGTPQLTTHSELLNIPPVLPYLLIENNGGMDGTYIKHVIIFASNMNIDLNNFLPYIQPEVHE